MTRRKMMLMAVLGATVVGLANLVGFANHNAVFASDDEDQAALIKTFGAAKIRLQQGLVASEQAGQPISGKFEVDDGALQLSVYTTKDGKFSEVAIDHVTGKVAKVEPITAGDNLTAANAQNATMAKAKTSLKAAIDKAVSQASDFRAVSVIPSLQDGHPVASIVLLKGEQIKTVQQSLD